MTTQIKYTNENGKVIIIWGAEGVSAEQIAKLNSLPDGTWEEVSKGEAEQLQAVIPAKSQYGIYLGMVQMVEATPPDVGWYAPEGVIVCQSEPPTNEPGKWIERDGVWQEVTLQTWIDIFTEQVQNRLDAFARSENRAYDNMLSVCTYATSTNPVFAAEGQYCVEARDNTWAAAYAFMNEEMPKVISGERGIPTWEELEAVLPELAWPEVG